MILDSLKSFEKYQTLQDGFDKVYQFIRKNNLHTLEAGTYEIDGKRVWCTISEGEWVMIPAGYSDFILSATQKETTLLEVYIVKQEEKDSYVAEEEHHHHEEGCNCGCHDHKH